MNEKLEKVSSPIKVSASTPPTVPPLFSWGANKNDGMAGITWGGIVHRVPSVQKNKLSGPPKRAEPRVNDGPERSKSVLFSSRMASPVNVKVSATAERLRKQTITREKTADLNDNPVMEVFLSDFLPRRVTNYRLICSIALLDFS
jgi:hypothetical protein